MLEYDVIDISFYIVEYSNRIDSPISNLKLQKLLYYSKAASLVEYGRKCFNAKIMAWEFGPVVVEAYQYFKEYGRDTIPNQKDFKKIKLDDKTMRIIYETSDLIDISTKKILEKVVDSYSSEKNPFYLVKKTHSEDPWKNTKLNQEIVCEDILKYYEKNPEKLWGLDSAKKR